MGLVPMHLCPMNRVVGKADGSKPFKLPPTALPVKLVQSTTIPNAVTSRNRLDTLDLSDDREIRGYAILPRLHN